MHNVTNQKAKKPNVMGNPISLYISKLKSSPIKRDDGDELYYVEFHCPATQRPNQDGQACIKFRVKTHFKILTAVISNVICYDKYHPKFKYFKEHLDKNKGDFPNYPSTEWDVEGLELYETLFTIGDDNTICSIIQNNIANLEKANKPVTITNFNCVFKASQKRSQGGGAAQPTLSDSDKDEDEDEAKLWRMTIKTLEKHSEALHTLQKSQDKILRLMENIQPNINKSQQSILKYVEAINENINVSTPPKWAETILPELKPKENRDQPPQNSEQTDGSLTPEKGERNNKEEGYIQSILEKNEEMSKKIAQLEKSQKDTITLIRDFGDILKSSEQADRILDRGLERGWFGESNNNEKILVENLTQKARERFNNDQEQFKKDMLKEYEDDVINKYFEFNNKFTFKHVYDQFLRIKGLLQDENNESDTYDIKDLSKYMFSLSKETLKGNVHKRDFLEHLQKQLMSDIRHMFQQKTSSLSSKKNSIEPILSRIKIEPIWPVRGEIFDQRLHIRNKATPPQQFGQTGQKRVKDVICIGFINKSTRKVLAKALVDITE